MIPKKPYRKINHLAVAGFLLPFAAAALSGALILAAEEAFGILRDSVLYLTLVPLILLAGLVSSIKSIPLIPERDDADYAFSGLTLNIMAALIYLTSLLYLFFLS